MSDILNEVLFIPGLLDFFILNPILMYTYYFIRNRRTKNQYLHCFLERENTRMSAICSVRNGNTSNKTMQKNNFLMIYKNQNVFLLLVLSINTSLYNLFIIKNYQNIFILSRHHEFARLTTKQFVQHIFKVLCIFLRQNIYLQQQLLYNKNSINKTVLFCLCSLHQKCLDMTIDDISSVICLQQRQKSS